MKVIKSAILFCISVAALLFANSNQVFADGGEVVITKHGQISKRVIAIGPVTNAVISGPSSKKLTYTLGLGAISNLRRAYTSAAASGPYFDVNYSVRLRFNGTVVNWTSGYVQVPNSSYTSTSQSTCGGSSQNSNFTEFNIHWTPGTNSFFSDVLGGLNC